MKKTVGITIALIIAYCLEITVLTLVFGDFSMVLGTLLGYVLLYYPGDKYYEKAKDFACFNIGVEMYFLVLLIWAGTVECFYSLTAALGEMDSSIIEPEDILKAVLCGASFVYLSFATKKIYKNGIRTFWEKSFIYKGFAALRLNWSKRKYRDIIAVMEKMAAGNLDIELPKRLGKFEGLREPLMKLRDGVDAAALEKSRSERMRVELITNVSHDLKTPLTAIITYIDLLKDEKLDDEKRREYLDILANRSERLKFLIEDLFEVSKAASGNVKFEPVEMDIVNLLKQVVFEYEDKLKSAGLEVEYEMPEGRTPIFADPQKTYRIYSNLIGNAAKYSLRNSRLYIQVTDTENEVMAVIKNVSANRIRTTGANLTERFVRGDESRITEGSGLGLAIAKNFTELQGGSLDIIVDGDLFKAVTVWDKYVRPDDNLEQTKKSCDNGEKEEG